MSTPELDSEGYLVNPDDWTEAMALDFARAENIELTDQHWTALRFMRDFLGLHRVPPDARFVIRHLTEVHGVGRNRLFELFPYGYVQQACKIAGMRRPRVWSTG
jgi:tRNA 2-thiouridine synthesizing protein E